MTRALNWLTVIVLVASVALRNPLLFLSGVLLALVASVTTLWDRYALTGVTYTRRLGATRIFVGEETDLWIQVTNAKPLPLAWLRIEDEIPDGIKIAKGYVYHSYKVTALLGFPLPSPNKCHAPGKQSYRRTIHIFKAFVQ